MSDKVLAYVLPCSCPPGEHLDWQRRDMDGFVAHLNEVYLSRPKPLPPPEPMHWPVTWPPHV
jgi:hypothetical protein